MIYKLVVISDIHHDVKKLERILPIINSSDYVVFCGDGLSDIMSMRGEIRVPLVCVRGNNDRETNIAELASVVFGTTRALVTHGHRQDARRGLDGLQVTAKLKNCSLVFFGHTHTYTDRIIDGVHFINPGALRLGSYALVLGNGPDFTAKQQFVV